MPDSVPLLIRQLTSNSDAEQLAAAEALARLGKEAQPAAAGLVAAMRTSDTATREWCAAALEELGPPPAAQIGELSELAEDTSLDVAYWAITLLGRAGNNAAKSVDTLANVLQNASDSALRERAAWALGKIGPAAAPAATALHQVASAGQPRLARLAKQALDQIES